MVLILIFAEVLGLYGYVTASFLKSFLTPDMRQFDRGNHHALTYNYWNLPCRPITACPWCFPSS